MSEARQPSRSGQGDPATVVITGGAGFLGVTLARALLARSGALAVGQLVLVDRVAPPPDLLADVRVRAVTGDLIELLAADGGRVLPVAAGTVVHLAAAVSGECEADFDLGLRSNLEASRALLEACRRRAQPLRFVFASSLAVFGAVPGYPLPPVVTDQTLPLPQNSYGTQKFIIEQLVADYTRKGFVSGRNLRLMTVSVRPGRPNGAASSFLSGIIREPLAGVRASCPVAPDTPVALASPARTIEGLLKAIDLDDAAWGPAIAFNLPALTTTPAAMAEALARVAGQACADRIDWQPDAAIERIVAGWPSRFDTARARSLGLAGDPDFDSVIRQYIAAQASAPG